MRFYTQYHKHYWGMELWARATYVCLLDQGGEIHLHHNIHGDPAAFLRVMAPYCDDLVVAIECVFLHR